MNDFQVLKAARVFQKYKPVSHGKYPQIGNMQTYNNLLASKLCLHDEFVGLRRQPPAAGRKMNNRLSRDG